MTDIITSTQNPRIKAVVDLHHARARRESGQMLIDGAREIGRAIDAGIQIDEAYFCPDRLDGGQVKNLVGRLQETGCAMIAVSDRVYDKIGYGERSDGIVAVARRPVRRLEECAPKEAALIGVIDGLEKPGNIGAIVRTADAARVTGIVVTDPASDPFGPNAIRASTGAIFNVPLVEAEAVAAREFLEKRKIQIIAADSEATTSFLDIDLTKPTAVVLGSEARGLTDTWRNIATAARVPMFGRVDSLNVSVTAAIIFYEALRQRLQLDRNDAAKHK